MKEEEELFKKPKKQIMKYPNKQDRKDLLTAFLFVSISIIVSVAVIHLREHCLQDDLEETQVTTKYK
jgi:hypothetical protein